MQSKVILGENESYKAGDVVAFTKNIFHMFLAKIMQHGNQFFQLTRDDDVIDIYVKLLEDAILKYNLIYDGCKKKFNLIPLQSVFNNTNALIENSVLSDEVQELFKPLFIAYQKIGTILGMIKNDSSLPDEFYESISGEVFLKGIGRYIEPMGQRDFLGIGIVDPSLTISFDY